MTRSPDVEHDDKKTNQDWFAVINYLHGKQVLANWDNNSDKMKHHIITMASVCKNWHQQYCRKLKEQEAKNAKIQEETSSH